MIEWTIILVTIAGLSSSAMDKLQFHYYTSIFRFLPSQFWNPEVSWKNKYINKDSTLGRRKILGTLNVPVFLTDGWHLLKAIHLNSICLAIAINIEQVSILWSFIVIRLILGLTFIFGYRILWQEE